MSEASSQGSKIVGLMASALLAGGVSYYVYKYLKKPRSTAIKVSDVSPAQMVELLHQLVLSQHHVKEVMKEIATRIFDEDMDFNEICQEVQKANTENPLEPYGLTIEEFSQLLAMHNSDPKIRSMILQLTAGPDVDSPNYQSKLTKLTQQYSSEDLITIHSYMLEQLKKVMEISVKEPLCVDTRVATIATQAFVGKVVQKKFGLKTEDLEMLTSRYQSVLRSDDRFFELGAEMRQVVSKLVSR